MKNKKRFDIPILFIIFRRKSTALRVIRAIARVKPRKLYISQDGPRDKKEYAEILETRKAILSKIDWDCRVTVWTHEKNLGLRKHIPEAFDKFFGKEEYGIYLEDDTVPSEDFFYFQEEMLTKYKNDKRIFYVLGTNFYPRLTGDKDSYYLSEMGNIWGLGIWKRSWKLYDNDLRQLVDITYEKFRDYIFDRRYIIYLKTFLSALKKGDLNSWDYQLDYSVLKNRMYFLEPKVNLVKNIGINKKATNLSLQNYESETSKIFPLNYPKSLNYLDYNKERDVLHFNYLFKYFTIRILLVRIYLGLPAKVKGWVNKIITFT